MMNYSKTTIDTYSRSIKNFYLFIRKYDGLNFDEVTKADVLQYLYYLNETRNKTRTRYQKLYALKAFYKWYIRRTGMINPTYKIESPKLAETLPKYLNLSKAKELQNAYNKENSRHYLRNNLIIQLFLLTGLRVSELCNIELSNINIAENSINVKCKGNKTRTTYFTNEYKKLLIFYCRKYKPQIYLFESKPNIPYTRRGIYEIISKAYQLIGEEGYSVHSLRHTAATLIYKQTKDLLLVKEFLGHESIESTKIYTHVDEEDIRKCVESNPLNTKRR